jgi:hypothetical protein
MRRLIPFAALLAAGCASTPAPEPVKPATSAPLLSGKHEHAGLNGMTAVDLAEHLGTAKSQVREGDGIKMQFVGPTCVLDAYLYSSPDGGGAPRVTHSDARNFQGAAVSVRDCIASIEGR